MAENLKNQNPEQKENGHENENDTFIPEEYLNEFPPEEKKRILSLFQYSGPQQNPIIKKITPQHITSLINIADESDKRDREERKSERNYNFKILVTVLVALIVICALFMWTKQEENLKYIIGGILGFGGGFGVGKYYRPRE